MATSQRRLSVVVCAEIVGYSRLFGADDTGTLTAFSAHRVAVDPLFAAEGGRVARIADGGLLLEFSSTYSAVRAALEVQRVMAERNAGVPVHRQQLFGIGIHLGDVTEEDGTISGDAVEVARRLQEIADPGGICLSQPVRLTVPTEVGALFRDGGPKVLKAGAAPLIVYNLELEPVAAPPAAAVREPPASGEPVAEPGAFSPAIAPPPTAMPSADPPIAAEAEAILAAVAAEAAARTATTAEGRPTPPAAIIVGEPILPPAEPPFAPVVHVAPAPAAVVVGEPILPPAEPPVAPVAHVPAAVVVGEAVVPPAEPPVAPVVHVVPAAVVVGEAVVPPAEPPVAPVVHVAPAAVVVGEAAVPPAEPPVAPVVHVVPAAVVVGEAVVPPAEPPVAPVVHVVPAAVVVGETVPPAEPPVAHVVPGAIIVEEPVRSASLSASEAAAIPVVPPSGGPGNDGRAAPVVRRAAPPTPRPQIIEPTVQPPTRVPLAWRALAGIVLVLFAGLIALLLLGARRESIVEIVSWMLLVAGIVVLIDEIGGGPRPAGA